MKNDAFNMLSDRALLEKVEELVCSERRITFNVVEHLAEVDRRRIYLAEGYASMFDYCTRGRGYSESATHRRIAAARCTRDFPEVARHVKNGTLAISTAALIAGVMNAENCSVLLSASIGKGERAVREVVAGYKTGKPFHDRITPLSVKRPALSMAMPASPAPPAHERSDAQGSRANRTNTTESGQNHLRSEGENNPVPSAAAANEMLPEKEIYYRFTIAADEEFMDLYRRVRAIQSIKANPGKDISSTFKALMTEYVSRHAPEEKAKRRHKRSQKVVKSMKKKPARSRYISEAIKDAVRTRDDHRCAYISPAGVRCGATQHLQFDHVRPFAKGGEHTIDNLRLLCAAHNQTEAAVVFGRAASTLRV